MPTDQPSLDAMLRAARSDVAGRPLGRRNVLRGASLAALALGAPSLLVRLRHASPRCRARTAARAPTSPPRRRSSSSPTGPSTSTARARRCRRSSSSRQQSGISVTYNTDINDNNDFFGKVKDQLGSCEPIGRDIITLTDWMAARMIGAGLDAGARQGQHAQRRGQPRPRPARRRSWDSDRDYSVPWQTGLTGIAYNAKYTDEVGSFEELMTRSDLKGKISLLSEMGDTMLFMLLLEGADPEDFSAEEWSAAIGRLEGYVGAGQVRRFTGNDYIRDLNAGNIVACEAWSGDVIAMQYDNPDIKWVVPEEGLSLWSDNMLVPNKADHKANAEALMNHYYDPEVAATLAAWVNYICPVAGAQEAMEKIDPSLVDNPLIFPDEEFLANAYGFMELDEKTRQQYDKDFAKVIGA